MPVSRARKKAKDADLDLFDEKQREIDARIAELEALPEQLELEMREQETTMPPPEDIEERRRQREFEERAARGQIRNERRTQGKSLILTVLLAAACAALISWVITLAGQ